MILSYPYPDSSYHAFSCSLISHLYKQKDFTLIHNCILTIVFIHSPYSSIHSKNSKTGKYNLIKIIN